MSDVPFIPFFAKPFIVDTLHLTAEERGIFVTLICMIATDRSPVDRDDKRMARACGCSKRAFSRALDSLLDLGCLELRDGHLHAPILGKFETLRRESQRRPPIPSDVRRAVFERDGSACAYCGDRGGPFHLDHIIPWSRGGKHDVSNLTVACMTCNVSKGAMTADEWRGS